MSEVKTKKNKFWMVVALGVAFLVLVGVAAFLTGYLLGDSEAGEVVALAIISAVTTAVGVIILLLVALIFHIKAKKHA
jgi:uncharacterized membrane protein (DUF485 family)